MTLHQKCKTYDIISAMLVHLSVTYKAGFLFVHDDMELARGAMPKQAKHSRASCSADAHHACGPLFLHFASTSSRVTSAPRNLRR